LLDSSEKNGISNVLIQLNPTKDIYVTSDDGIFYFNADTSIVYSIELLNPRESFKLNSCTSTSASITFKNVTQDTLNFDFPIKFKACTAPQIKVWSTRRRRCAKNITFLQIKNESILPLTNAELVVDFPDEVVPIKSSKPWTKKVGNRLIFENYQLIRNGTDLIYITDSVKCGDENFRGRNVCTKASINIKSNCSDTLNWDKSNLKITASCTNNSNVEGVISNVGTGDMVDSSTVFFFINDNYIQENKIKLNAFQNLKFTTNIGNQLLRIEALENRFNPHDSLEIFELENCTNDNTPSRKGFRPLKDNRKYEDVECLEIRDSYDPNIKIGLPKGVTNNNYIKSGTRLEYNILFQNFGNDTAYNVVVLDTLNENLDIRSLRFTGSSDSYYSSIKKVDNTYRLGFNFFNINLPDTSKSKVESIGNVKFSIVHKSSIPQNTILKNRAAIYFDFNKPVLTNFTSHIVKDTIFKPNSTQVTLHSLEEPVFINHLYFNNPVSRYDLIQIRNHISKIQNIEISDLSGSILVKKWKINKNEVSLAHQLIPGLYLCKMNFENGLSISKKLMITE
jgi:uncharacterized repeat protein (TIGR01451 family)